MPLTATPVRRVSASSAVRWVLPITVVPAADA
jgi:hypothetical protein